MPEIDWITVKGFKSLASIEKLPLRAVNILIGPNGSGKSNFIGVFAFLHSIRAGRLQEYVLKAGGAERVLHFGSKVTNTLEIQISFKDGLNQYSIGLGTTDTDELIPVSEHASFRDNKNQTLLLFQSGNASRKEAVISTQQSSKVAKYVQEHLEKWRVYHFHDTSSASPMKKTADINDNRFLRTDGSNLAAFLYFLRKRHEASYGLIVRTVQRVAPFFKDFQLEPQGLNPDKIRLEWMHVGSDAYFDASSLSDGTLRFIALTTLFLQPELYRPSMILVDEPELGLHPYAITILASLVQQASQKTQVLISTQSPQLLDNFDPEDVLVADRVNGSTQFTRLDSAKLASWLEDYSLGQLWEKNQFGGRPALELTRHE